MAFQNISNPRVFLNLPEYSSSVSGTSISKLFRTIPVNANTVSGETSIPVVSSLTYTKPYVAFLGHNLASQAVTWTGGDATDIFNATSESFKKGFSIFEFATTEIPTAFALDTSATISSVVAGTYFDFPVNPDLSLSLEYQYDGFKETTTRGGSTIINKFFSKPPLWGNGLGAWELGGGAAHSKSGRRIWNLNWSYLSDSAIWPTNAHLVNNDDENSTTNTLLDNDTIQRCIHLCNGGEIPFLFCSDGDNIRQDNMAIARFDMKSFKFSQVSMNTYNCKIRIKEIW